MKYEINDETVAIIPIDSSNTKIIELTKEYDVPQSTFEILEENCEYYGSTYNGRIKAAQKILNFSYKIPLLVEESGKIIFFPTRSSNAIDCCWINHNFVKKREKNGKQTKVMFSNGVEKTFNISKLSFENQLLRAGMLDAMISKRIKQK
ncbi:MAG: competence protein ComK [Bacilli bacterium]|nr:competence protein ComK [Bacilli bacterium]